MKKLKIVGCVDKKLLGNEFECECDSGKRISIPGIIDKPLKVVSIIPDENNPTHVRFQNVHLTILCKIIG